MERIRLDSAIPPVAARLLRLSGLYGAAECELFCSENGGVVSIFAAIEWISGARLQSGCLSYLYGVYEKPFPVHYLKIKK